jgi:hypothetical protein
LCPIICAPSSVALRRRTSARRLARPMGRAQVGELVSQEVRIAALTAEALRAATLEREVRPGGQGRAALVGTCSAVPHKTCEAQLAAAAAARGCMCTRGEHQAHITPRKGQSLAELKTPCSRAPRASAPADRLRAFTPGARRVRDDAHRL